MTVHAEKRVINHQPEDLYALVADVQKYPEFLPWCLAARIREKSPISLSADLIIGFNMFRERFTSDFEFNSRLLQSVIETLFTEAVKRMVRAFETRADILYKKSE